MAQEQLVSGAGHPDVEEPPLLLQTRVTLRQDFVDKFCGQTQRVAPGSRGETAVHEPDHEDDRELEPLGLVHGENRHGIGVGVDLGRGRVITRVDERLQVAGHEDDPIVRQQVRLRADDVEEAGDVLERLLRGDRLHRRQLRKQPAPTQELVQHFAGRPLVGQLGIAPNVPDQPLEHCPRRRGEPQQPRLAGQLLDHVPKGAVAATRRVEDGSEVLATQAVHLRGRQRVKVDARGEIRDRAQKGQQQPDLGPRIQPRRSREVPRHPGHVQ